MYISRYLREVMKARHAKLDQNAPVLAKNLRFYQKTSKYTKI